MTSVPEQKLRDLLRSRRLELGLSQKAVGLKSGCTTNSVYAFEKGRLVPSRSVLIEGLARALQLDPAVLHRLVSEEQAHSRE